MFTLDRVITLVVTGLVLFGSSDAQSQSRIILGSAAGGTTDLVAREVAAGISSILGEQYVVENKTGATQRIALGEVRKSPPDGRTLLLATNTPFTILPIIYGDKVGYDPVKDFTPIARVVTFDNGIAIGPKVNGNSFADYLAWCKANPNDASYGTPGAGTNLHFIGVLIGKAIGVPLAHVPYRGGTPAISDLIGGHVPMVINSLADFIPNHKAGNLKVVAVTGPIRSPLTPEIPTVKELGVDISAVTAIDIYGPAGMAPDLVKKINGAIVQAINNPETRNKLVTYGLNLSPSSSEELARLQIEETRMWVEPVRASGYKGE